MKRIKYNPKPMGKATSQSSLFALTNPNRKIQIDVFDDTSVNIKTETEKDGKIVYCGVRYSYEAMGCIFKGFAMGCEAWFLKQKEQSK